MLPSMCNRGDSKLEDPRKSEIEISLDFWIRLVKVKGSWNHFVL